MHLLVLAAKNRGISYAGAERKYKKRKEKKGAAHIKGCVVKNECELSHTLRMMEMAAVLPGGGGGGWGGD